MIDWLYLASKEFCFRYFVSATAVSLHLAKKEIPKTKGYFGEFKVHVRVSNLS